MNHNANRVAGWLTSHPVQLFKKKRFCQSFDVITTSRFQNHGIEEKSIHELST